MSAPLGPHTKDAYTRHPKTGSDGSNAFYANLVDKHGSESAPLSVTWVHFL